jgi:hypothetical protein
MLIACSKNFRNIFLSRLITSLFSVDHLTKLVISSSTETMDFRKNQSTVVTGKYDELHRTYA